MRTKILYFVLGIIFVFCIAANYRIQIDKNVYTNTIDPNDPIYNKKYLTIDREWLIRFGNCERTLIFYNLAVNRAKIQNLEQEVNNIKARLAPLDMNDLVTVPTSKDPNDK